MRSWLSACLTALAVGLSACGTGALDYPLAGQQRNVDRRMVDTAGDRPFIVLAFSGGGSRAAALAAAVTARLDGITYQTASGERRLSQDIAVVSSVSGGSVYATYLALNGASGASARTFEDKIQQFDGIGYLAKKAVNPATWINLQFENKTRIDVLQEMLSDFLGTHASLAELNKPGKPIVLLNASDMVAGEAFTFDPDTLDDLCMAYDSTPLVLATSASAAFPVAFTPVLLKNNSYVDPGCTSRQIPAGNWRNALTQPSGPYANLEAFRHARYRDSLRADANSFRRPQYVRLVDGGVVDNLGLTSVRRALLTPGSPASLTPLISDGKLGRLVVIVVNARGDVPSALDSTPKYTTIPTILSSITGVLVDSASAGAAATFRGFILNLAGDRNDLVTLGEQNAKFEIYPIDVDFDQLPNASAEERARLNRVKEIPTSWTLPKGDVALLDSVAGELLWRHPCFRKLMADIKTPAHEEAPAVPLAICQAPPIPSVP